MGITDLVTGPASTGASINIGVANAQNDGGGSNSAPATTNTIAGSNINDILNNIKNLQETEQALITKLDTYTSASGYTSNDPEITEMVNTINSIADARIGMFKNISTNASILQAGVSQSRIDLVSQMTLLQVVEDQLNQAKSKIQLLSNRNDTKMRMVQINTYYGQRYEAQSNLMKKIILVCLPILVLYILKKKNILPETIANYVIGIVVAIGSIFIVYNIWDIFTRNNMDFNSYDWNYEQPGAQIPSIWESNKQNFFKFDNLLKNLMGNLGLCVAESCCADGLTYDDKNLKCVVPPTRSGFMNRTDNAQIFTSGNGLKGTVITSYVGDQKNTNNGIVPFSYDMNYAPL
jgi:hypothetical protein